MQIHEYQKRGFYKKLPLTASTSLQADLQASVSEILADIAENGDKAILKYTKQFDQTKLTTQDLRIPVEKLEKASTELPSSHRKAIKEAIKCIRDFHKKTRPQNWYDTNPHGATVGEQFFPIERVGLYIPGGHAPLVSTVLMTAIPAQVAGCKDIAVCTPPLPDGTVHPALLAALKLSGIEEVYCVGGVQAIGALAYGTRTIPPVFKIGGPGNAYVTEAKRQLFGKVGIDLLPGPSEILVASDDSARIKWIAAELIAQAEHGSGKERLFWVTNQKDQVPEVKSALASQLIQLTHADTISHAIQKQFHVIVCEQDEEMIEVINHIAPEHLQLMTKVQLRRKLLRQVTTAGAVMLGHHSPTAIGDFTAGPSHTLPTGGTGRFSSGLQVSDFMRRSSIIEYDEESLQKALKTVQAFGEMENMDAHSASASIRSSS